MLAELDPGQRPRERMLRLGADALSDAELVALLLGSGRRGVNVLDVARDLLAAHGGLSGLARADSGVLAMTLGIGPAKATRVVAALALARRFGTSTDRRDTVRGPADVARLAEPLLARDDDPRLVVVVCDRANRVLGTTAIDGSRAHDGPFPVRDALAETLRRGGVALALAHRHDGDPAPTAGDRDATEHLAAAAGQVAVRLLDHVVLGPGAGAGGTGPTTWRSVTAGQAPPASTSAARRRPAQRPADA